MFLTIFMEALLRIPTGEPAIDDKRGSFRLSDGNFVHLLFSAARFIRNFFCHDAHDLLLRTRFQNGSEVSSCSSCQNTRLGVEKFGVCRYK